MNILELIHYLINIAEQTKAHNQTWQYISIASTTHIKTIHEAITSSQTSYKDNSIEEWGKLLINDVLPEVKEVKASCLFEILIPWFKKIIDQRGSLAFLDTMECLLDSLGLDEFKGFNSRHYDSNIPQFKYFIEEIKNNRPDGKYTHSQVLLLVRCAEANLSAFDFEKQHIFKGYLNGIRTHGITHKERSSIAYLLLKEVENYEQETKGNRKDF